MISGVNFICNLVTSCVSQELILGLTLFNISINDLDVRPTTPLTSLLHRKLEGVDDTPETVHKERLRKLRLFSLQMGRLNRILSMCLNV